MKNLLTTVSILFYSLLSFSQTLEWSDNRKFSDQADLAFMNSRGELFVGGSSLFDQFAPPSFMVLDSLGNLLSKQYFDGFIFEVGSLNDIIEMETGEILVLGNGGLCDVCCWSTIQKYSPDWEPVWPFDFSPQFSGFAEKMAYDFEKLVYVLVDKNSMEVFDLETQQPLLELDFGNKEFNDVLAISTDEIILAGQGLSFVQSISEVFLPDYDFSQIEMLSDSTIVGMNEKNIYVIDDTFGIQHHLALLNTPQKIKKISVSDTNIGVLVEEDGFDLGVVLRHDLFVAHSFPLDSVGVKNQAVAIQGNELFITGTELSENKSMFGKSYAFDGQTVDYETDIGISGFEMGVLPFVKEQPPWGGTIIRMEDIDFTIHNYGNTVIDNFRLNGQFENLEFICYLQQTFQKEFENIQLNPGESVIVTLDSLEFFTADLQPSYDFCFWTSVPNHKVDRDHGNDNYCEDIIINDIDEISVGNALNVFPNPANSELKVELPATVPAKSIKIFDLYGKLFLEKKNPFQTSTIYLDIKDLPTGTYLVKAQSNKQIFLSKFIKI